ncbi:T9SS type A sorting domain-containing protein [Neolewinella sp.]|uniref:T9SS type A sorting domain-containing protein n=1 Tax=Neolewinella sp. TaxID=2993543 RepID=UPI003B522110
MQLLLPAHMDVLNSLCRSFLPRMTLFVLLGACPVVIYAQFVSITTGFWDYPSTWAGGEVPGKNATVIIGEGTEVTIGYVDHPDSLQALTIVKGATLKVVDASKAITSHQPLYCYGRIYVQNGLILNTDLRILKGGTFIWLGGNLTTKNEVGLIDNQGSFYVGTQDGMRCDLFVNAAYKNLISVEGSGGQVTFGAGVYLQDTTRMVVSRERTVVFEKGLYLSGITKMKVQGKIRMEGEILQVQTSEKDVFSGGGTLELANHSTDYVRIYSGGSPLAFSEVRVEPGIDLTLVEALIPVDTKLILSDSVGIASHDPTINRGLIQMTGTTFMNDFNVHNYGRIEWKGADLLPGPLSYQRGGRIHNWGVLDLAPTGGGEFSISLQNEAGGEISIAGGGSVTLTDPIGIGSTNLEGGKVIVPASGQLTIAAGRGLENRGEISLAGELQLAFGSDLRQPRSGRVTGTGRVNIFGRFMASGVISSATWIHPGGVLTSYNLDGLTCTEFLSDLSLGGTFVSVVHGQQPCTEHNQLLVRGTLSLGGRLAFVDPPIDVELGQVATFLAANQLVGEFAEVPSLISPLRLVYNYPMAGQVSLVNGTGGGPAAAACDTVPFGSGVNFISFDVLPAGEGGRISHLIANSSGTSGIFFIQRRTADQGIETYLPGYPAYGIDFAIEPGEAYRIYSFNEGELKTCGIQVPANTRPAIAEGYNWVGYVPQEPRSPDEYFGKLPGFYYAAERRGSLTGHATRYYVPSFPFFSSLPSVENGVGYEVYSFAAADSATWLLMENDPERQVVPEMRGSNVYSTYTGDIYGLAAGAEISLVDDLGRSHATGTVDHLGHLLATTVFGYDSLSGAYPDLRPGDDLYLQYGDRRSAEPILFDGQGGVHLINQSFSEVPALADKLPEDPLQIFPNPFTAVLNVTLQVPAGQDVRLSLVDVQGRLVQTRQVPSAATDRVYADKFLLKDLPTGLYLLRYTLGGSTVATHKVYKQR